MDFQRRFEAHPFIQAEEIWDDPLVAAPIGKSSAKILDTYEWGNPTSALFKSCTSLFLIGITLLTCDMLRSVLREFIPLDPVDQMTRWLSCSN